MHTSSIIHRNGNNGKGTLGGFFRMGGVLYGLSNNHVIADINQCQVGDLIFDDFNRMIGTLSHWVRLNTNGGINLVDVALFRYTAASPPTWLMARNALKPAGFTPPVQDGHVYIVHPDGTIREGWISIPYTTQILDFILCGEHFSFTHLTEITPMNDAPFADPGASGSVVFSSFNNMAVGVVTGTAKDGIKSYAIPFADGVLNYLPLAI